MEDWVPEGSTMNQYYYKRVLEKLRKKFRRKRPELWKNEFILYQDNAPALTASSIKKFLEEKQIPTLNHPPYLHDLAPCNFFLVSKSKTVLREQSSTLCHKWKKKRRSYISYGKDPLQCFDQWKTRMQRYVDAQGNTTKGKQNKRCFLLNKMTLCHQSRYSIAAPRIFCVTSREIKISENGKEEYCEKGWETLPRATKIFVFTNNVW